MLFILLGLALGTLVALGYIPLLAGPIASLSASLMSAANNLVVRGVHAVGVHSPRTAEVLGVCLGVALPGLVCLFLLLAAKLGVGLRRGVSVVLGVVAIGGFFVLPANQATVLAALAGGVAVIFSLASGFGVLTPIAALAGALAVSSGRVLLHGQSPEITKGVNTLVTLVPSTTPYEWHIVLLVLAWAGFVGAGLLVLSPLHGSSKPS